MIRKVSLPIFFQKNFSSLRGSVWTRRIQIWHPAEKISTTGQKIFAQCLKSLRKFFHFFSRKKRFNFHQSVSLDKWSSVFTTPSVKKVSTKTQKLCVQCSKIMKNHVSFGKSFFIKTIRWTSKLQFRRPS